MTSRFTLIVLFEIVFAAAAFANPIGEWLVADHSSKIAIQKCGANLCGKITWTADGVDIGRMILIDMQPEGDHWTGMIVDVRDNTKYTAQIRLQNDRTLKVDGCVLAGAICGGETWARTK